MQIVLFIVNTADNSHCFLTQVYTWGCNDEGALGRLTSSSGGEEFTAGQVQEIETVNVIMVSAGDSHTMALSDKGIVYGWGTYRVIYSPIYSSTPIKWLPSVESIKGADHFIEVKTFTALIGLS